MKYMVLFGLTGGVVGVILLLLGVFLVFFFPGTAEHQGSTFSTTGIILGIIFLMLAGAFFFL
ncbi:MAG: hypothetical protein KKA90_02840 [Nanoarchaeota archaeon]|nr:hypothetical protein [Nanoarchaeota archaeon]